MYVFKCGKGHASYSAAKVQRNQSCPTCGGETTRMTFRIRSNRTGAVVVGLAEFTDAKQWVDETVPPAEKESYLTSFDVSETRKSGENTIERLS